jgi:hypothetical protein
VPLCKGKKKRRRLPEAEPARKKLFALLDQFECDDDFLGFEPEIAPGGPEKPPAAASRLRN